MPVTVTVTGTPSGPGSWSAVVASLICLSVVIMAPATASRSASASASSGTSFMSPCLTFVRGSRTPITPVDMASVRSGSVPSSAARALLTSAWSASPSTPVAAFAEPAVTTTASAQPNRPPPPISVALRWALEILIGAATTPLRVKTAAAAADSRVVAMTPRSGRPDGLMPAAVPPARNPPGIAARRRTAGRR